MAISGTTILLHILGGAALLLWGLRMVRTGITRAYGSGLRRAVGAGLANPLSAPARAYSDAARRLMGDNLAINVPLERFNLLGRIFGGRAA